MTDEQFAVLAGLLLEIRDALVLSVTVPELLEGCPHPDDHRVSLATPSMPDHWICNVCRYEHGGLSQQ